MPRRSAPVPPPAELLDLLSAPRRIVLLTHHNPDADTVGSALALARALTAAGHTCWVTTADGPVPEDLHYLPGAAAAGPAPGPSEVDLAIALDCATAVRLGGQRRYLEAGIPVVKIDHHQGSDHYGTINWVDPDQPACALLAYRLMRELRLPIDSQTATLLYAGIFTDTMGFTVPGTNAEVLSSAAKLASAGADVAGVARSSFGTHSLARLRLEGNVLAQMKVEMEGELVWARIPRAMTERFGAREQEADAIISSLQTASGARVIVLLREAGPRDVRVRIRTRGGIDAAALCAQFGGGGHRGAGGASLALPLHQAQQRVLAAARLSILRARAQELPDIEGRGVA
jgi:phosphoesterase RecJ-like protein